MDSNRHNASLTSSEKKRLRDRRAQQALREKREARIKTLEDRVAFCDQHHAAGWVQQLFNAVHSLRQENETLRARQKHLSHIVTSWKMTDDFQPLSGQHPPRTSIDPHHNSAQATSPFYASHIKLPPISGPLPNGIMGIPMGMEPSPGSPLSGENTGVEQPAAVPRHHSDSPQALSSAATATLPETIHLPGLSSCSPLQAIPSAVPPWCLLPMNESTPDTFVPTSCPWLGPTDLVASCPPHPSPLDLLHGTRCNYLADQIHRAIRLRAMRDSECLALGWLTYLYSRWRASPSPATFGRLTDFQRPLLPQLQNPHPVALDLIIWPQMRVNLVRHWEKYDFAELAGYMSCCVKVRWPWGKDVLERDADNNLQIRMEFLDVFTSEKGWGMTSEFIDKYPELLEGMDVEAMRFQITFPSEEDLSRGL